MNIGMIILKQNISTMRNYATWIQIAFIDRYMLRLKMLTKILQMMLKKDLIHQIMKLIDH